MNMKSAVRLHRHRLFLIVVILFLGRTATTAVAELTPETVEAFDKYIAVAEKQMGEQWKPDGIFLRIDHSASRDYVRRGKVVIELLGKKGGIPVRHGLIHDWTGSIFIPEADMATTLEVLQDFGNHANIYEEVIDSRLLERNGGVIRGFHRYKKKKVITAILDVVHEATYIKLSDMRHYCRSYSIRINEIKNGGKKNEKILPAGKDNGFLWRMNAYWKIEAIEDGVFIECRSISLTRDIPAGLGWIVKPFIQNMPRDSLIKTLKATRTTIEKNMGQTPAD
jgi:hypothetical protein